MTPAELARRIDHTILKPEATAPEVHQVVTDALRHGFATVCVAPAWVANVSAMLRGSSVKCCTVAAFPHGSGKATVKAIEATVAIKDGASEVDVVAFLPFLVNIDFASAKAELIEIARAARAAKPDVVLKVIVESALLMSLAGDKAERAIAAACRAVRESGCDFIKTSTGFHPAGGATVEAVRLMKKHAEGLSLNPAICSTDWAYTLRIGRGRHTSYIGGLRPTRPRMVPITLEIRISGRIY
jgi:deoxyribose-phosphate aldolase